MAILLDASALLAFLLNETGAHQVEKLFPQNPSMSVVNFAEVIGRADRAEIEPDQARLAILALPVTLIPLDSEIAFQVGKMEKRLRPLGLSFGDRACLATGKVMNMTIVTADRIWVKAMPELDIQLIR